MADGDRRLYLVGILGLFGMIGTQGVGISYDARSAAALEDLQVSIARVVRRIDSHDEMFQRQASTISTLNNRMSEHEGQISGLGRTVLDHSGRIQRLEEARRTSEQRR